MKHVIIGAGAAGISAAKTIRGLKPQDDIVIISTDEAVYSRVMLHFFISGQRDEKGMSFIADDFFEAHNIRWISGKSVTGIHTAKKEVIFADGAETFDTLLIASGADSVALPIQKEDPKNVFGLRHLSDAKAIREKAANAENIIIIGAGLVGLDAAYALLALGKKPVVIDMSEQVLPLNLDAHGAEAYQKKFEEAGCTFYLGDKVSAADSHNGSVASVTLDSGKVLPCDMAVVAVGVRPAVKFLDGSGIDHENGVTVNNRLATNVPGIYAAGDVTGLSGIWPNAMKQGEVAAKNMCGVPTLYDDVFAQKNTANYFGLVTLSIGETVALEGDRQEIRESKKSYEKVIVRDGVVVGVILQGNIGGSGFWQYLIKNRIDISKINASVFDLSFADFYGVKDNGEYQWVV